MDDLIHTLRIAVARTLGELGFATTRFTIEPVLNWGGFINHSYRVSVGERVLRLKLTADPAAMKDLERWHRFAPALAARFHAPEMLAWMDVPVTGWSGPVFPWIDATTPSRLDERLLAEVGSLLEQLQSDPDLSESLAGLGDPVTSCAEAYRRTYHRRFMEDLDFVSTDPPGFVDRDALVWMRQEALALESMVLRSRAFDEVADAPTHGDLWLDNLLVGASEQFWVLDWDGLGLGDPVMDWAMLCGPSRSRLDAHDEADRVVDRFEPAGRERFATYLRAALLDWIIDPLADWVQAGREPHFRAEIREANEGVYRRALSLYRERYPTRSAGRGRSLT